MTEDKRKIYQVIEITRLIKYTLEDEIGDVWIEGECSNVGRPGSGHIYFTLKDAGAQLQCAFFKGSQRGLKVDIKDGTKIRAYGQITVYEQRGQYQMIVRQVEEAGKGSLHEAFEKLKKKLADEGLFDEKHKNPIPLLPQHIGVVTSATGAALQDFFNVINRRYPNLHIVLAPVRVQGEGAAQEIADAIDRFNRHSQMDVLVIGRGGGSLEDLWCFNEEVVARAIAHSGIPIISAVGHEIDFTISDFVADLRAPTPSAAAEIVVGQKADFDERIAQYSNALRNGLERTLLRLRQRLTAASKSYVFKQPESLVRHYRQELGHTQTRLRHLLRDRWQTTHQLTDELGLRMTHQIERRLQHVRQQIERAPIQLESSLSQHVKSAKQEVQSAERQLRALSPLGVLDRGYSITWSETGEIIRDLTQVTETEKIETQLAKGRISSTITNVEQKEPS